MQISIYADPMDAESLESSIRRAMDMPGQDVKISRREHFDANDIVAIILDLPNRDYQMLLIAFLLGTRTRFQIDHKGLKIEIRNLETLSKIWEAWKSAGVEKNEDD